MFGTIGGFIMFIIIAVVILSILSTCIRIMPQVQALVVGRLGAYLGTYSVGVHFLVPLADRVVKKVNLREQVEDFPPQPVIIKDNVIMQIDTVVFFYITNPKLCTYGMECPLLTIENLTTTILWNITGDLKLDEMLTSREAINAKTQESLDIATDPWGIKVTRVEFKNIISSAAIQEAMEKQMRTECERRGSILGIEGRKKFMILVTGGDRRSAILNAEAGKGAAILKAEAEREKKTEGAQGQTEAIRSVQKTTADGIHFIEEAGADNAVLQLKSLEAFQTAVNGEANKVIIPSDIQGIASLAKSVVEVTAKSEAAE